MADPTDPTPRPHAKPEIWRPKFLATLAKCGVVSEAARVARINRVTAYDAREVDLAFAAAWDDALEQAIDSLELAAVRRAKKSSDALLMFLLKARRPDTYRETVRQEHSGPGGGPISLQFEALTETELHERARLVLLDPEDGNLSGDSAPLRITGSD